MKSDVFRKEFKPLNDSQKEHMANIKDKAEELLQAFNDADWGNTEPNTEVKNRCIAIARTNLEQAVMWAVKGISS